MFGTNARMGEGDPVAEADKRRQLSLLAPIIAVVTNIDKEHMDFHQTMERLNQLSQPSNRIPFTA
jgi:UDP-N-acetylmuramate--alanine ligase